MYQPTYYWAFWHQLDLQGAIPRLICPSTTSGECENHTVVWCHIRLGVHPPTWKTARGIVIPKPGKADYGAAKAYRVISLLNCLGKMVEKVAATLISNHCEREGAFHPGQYGCRAQRSSTDAVGLAIARTQEAWTRKKMVGALLIDVASAFPSVAKGCLLRKMRRAGLDEDLVRWTDSFMRNCSVIMSVDGQDSQVQEVTTGLPQGSPVSLVLFNLYIGEIHGLGAVEGRVPGAQGISFVDDVTWFVEGSSIQEVREQLEWCAEESLRWAEGNAVRFEVSKTEAVLLSRKRGLVQSSAAEPVRVGDRLISFASEATRWLGVWLDSALTLRTSRRKVLNRARAKEAALRRLVTKRGLAPAAARNLQQKIVSGTIVSVVGDSVQQQPGNG